MKRTIYIAALCAASTSYLVSCGGSAEKAKDAASDSNAPAAVANHISIKAVGQSPEFANATLTMKSSKTEKVGKDSTKVSFEFDVKNYELKAQTADSATKGCNNSHQGQHIHFILDNAPYKALYEPKNAVTFANDGKEHYLMCFLSRSYHESLKNKEAAMMLHFKIDEKGQMVKMDAPKTPMVFYSRPKGDYIGKDTANILLDFYVWNGTLQAGGNSVKAHISNPDKKVDTTVTISSWASNFIEGMGTGKGRVELSLVDKDGKDVDGPMTKAARDFNLLVAEAPKK